MQNPVVKSLAVSLLRQWMQIFCAPSVHSGSAWRLCWGILGSGGMRCWAALSPLTAAQTLLGGNSQAGPQQKQSCLGFSIIKYISASLGQSWNSHWISDVSLTCWIEFFSWIFFCFYTAGERALDSFLAGILCTVFVPVYWRAVLSPLTPWDPLQLQRVQVEVSSSDTSNKMVTAMCIPAKGWSLPSLG